MQSSVGFAAAPLQSSDGAFLDPQALQQSALQLSIQQLLDLEPTRFPDGGQEGVGRIHTPPFGALARTALLCDDFQQALLTNRCSAG